MPNTAVIPGTAIGADTKFQPYLGEVYIEGVYAHRRK